MYDYGYGDKTFFVGFNRKGKYDITIARGSKNVWEYHTVEQVYADIPKGSKDDIIIVLLEGGGRQNFRVGLQDLFAVSKPIDNLQVIVLPTQQKPILVPLLAHELGHTFGLNHNYTKGSLMYSTIEAPLDGSPPVPPGRLLADEALIVSNHAFFTDYTINDKICFLWANLK